MKYSEPHPADNPLERFHDAMNDLGPEQSQTAIDSFNRWTAARIADPKCSVEFTGGQQPIVFGPEVMAKSASIPDLNGGGSAESPPKKVESGGAAMSPRCNAGLGAAPSLEAFTQTLRDYQRAALDDAGEFIQTCWSEARPIIHHGQAYESQRIAYSAPTGTGKGSTELALLKELREQGINAWILTPALEVIRGFLERCGVGDVAGLNEEQLHALAEGIFVTTPIRARNRMLEAARGSPEIVIYDEVHHAISTNDVSGTLFAIAPDAVWVGFTATPYRASPKATAQLHEDWGEPVEIMSIPDAIAAGWQALPTFAMSPLVDDDAVKVANGQFQVKATTKAYGSRIADLAKLIVEERASYPTYPCAVSVPSSDVAGMLVEALDAIECDSVWVHQGTKAKERTAAYAQCKACAVVLVSIKVLNEGVDFPWLRLGIDARPTLSPVAWLQWIGRFMRPARDRPRIVCTNRNLERFAYLLQGAMPRKTIVEAQQAFDLPSKRTGIRQIGLESLKRFKAIPLPLYGGLVGAMYCVYSIDEDTSVKTQYVTLLDPSGLAPIVVTRSIPPVMEGEDARSKESIKRRFKGKWRLCTMPTDFVGFATTPASGPFSDKQKTWWARDAGKFGLEPNPDKLTRRQFAALPILSHCKRNMLGGAV